MNSVNWDNYQEMSDGQITFNLYSEGKSIELIAKIRNLDKGTVQNQLIEYKMKNRYTARIKTPQDIFDIFANTNKNDKLKVLNAVDDKGRVKLIEFINKKYTELNYTDKTTAAWIIGELRAVECSEVLKKASVHKAVSVRRMAVSAMGKLNDENLVPALVRALSDNNDQVALYAVNAIRKLKCGSVREKVLSFKGKRKDYVDRAIDSYISELDGEMKE